MGQESREGYGCTSINTTWPPAQSGRPEHKQVRPLLTLTFLYFHLLLPSPCLLFSFRVCLYAFLFLRSPHVFLHACSGYLALLKTQDLKLPRRRMVNKSAKNFASPVGKQDDANASAAQGSATHVPEGTGAVAPSPAVVTRSQARAVSESPAKLLGSPKKLASSRKSFGVGASASAPTLAAQEPMSSSYRDVFMDRARADSPIDVDEGEPPRSSANRRLEEVAVTVEGTPSYAPLPVETRDAWSVVLQEGLARRAQAEAVETPAARAPPKAEYVPAPVFREPAGTLGAPNQAHARFNLACKLQLGA